MRRDLVQMIPSFFLLPATDVNRVHHRSW
jgi:hypothetical protein